MIEGIKLADADSRMVGSVLLDTLQHEGKVKQVLDITHASKWAPSRVVFGKMERVYQTYSKIYKPVKSIFGTANAESMGYVKAWHGILASRRLLKVTKEEGDIYKFRLPIKIKV